MFNLDNLKKLPVFLLVSLMSFAQDINIPNLELIKNVYNEKEEIDLQLRLSNFSDKDTIVIIGDPWIRESWDSTGPYYNVGFDSEDIYPFVMLTSTDDMGMTADVSRSIRFSIFNNFVQILPKQSILLGLNLNLTQSAMEKYSNLSLLISVPYTNIKTINDNIRENQIVHHKEHLIITLVEPRDYITPIQERDDNSIKIADIFTDYIGINVRIK